MIFLPRSICFRQKLRGRCNEFCKNIFPTDRGGGQDCTDDSEAFHAAADEAKMPSHVCECDLIERDGRYTALFRNQNGGVANVLYASESEDGVRG